MSSPRRFRRLFRIPWRTRAQIRADIDTELAFHIDMRAEELAQAGLDRDTARREAIREFGDMDNTRRYCDSVDAGAERADAHAVVVDALVHDVRTAWRALRRSPAFAAVAVLTLALGLGANTAIFSVVNAVLLRGLPYVAADRLIAVYENNTTVHARWELSAADFVDYRARQHTLADFGGTAPSARTYLAPEGAEMLQGLRVTANVLSLLGTRPLLGRVFAAGEDSPSAPQLIILSYDSWQRLFGGDSSVIGRGMILNERTHTIIGVMPRGFSLGSNESYWIPLDLTPQLNDVNRARKYHLVYGIGRLKPGVTVDQAQADLLTISRDLERDYPAANKGHLALVMDLRTALLGDVRQATMLLAAAAASVLLIACANLANLLLSRAVSRRRELAVRAALGASRARLVRQALIESVMLAVIAATVGIVVATWGTSALLAMSPTALPPLADVRVDPTVLVFTLVVSVVAGMTFGTLPSVLGSNLGPADVLKSGGRTSTGGRAVHRLHETFVVVQSALAVVLVLGAGLLIRSLERLQHVEMGFDARNTIVARLTLGGSRYDSLPPIVRFYESVLQRVRALPGVEIAGVASHLPTQGGSGTTLRIEGRPGEDEQARYHTVSGDYFRALRIPVIRGRVFSSTDGADAPHVVVINEAMAERHWANADPIGARIRLGPNPKASMLTIVGIVGNVRQDGLDRIQRATVYTSYTQDGWSDLSLVVRTRNEAPAMARELRSIVHDVDPRQPVLHVRWLSDVVRESTARRRFIMTLLSVFAVVALGLACTGVYAVTAYSVAARMPEFGIRMALGATSGALVANVVRGWMAVVAVGLPLGAIGGAVAARLLEGQLFGVRPLDAATYAVSVATLLVVALIATVAPAWRATRADPVSVLRAD